MACPDDRITPGLLKTESLLGEEEREGLVQNTILGAAFRLGFLCLLLVAWLPMVYYGAKARIDFGW